MAHVILEDESLRDGLQFEKTILLLEEKLLLFQLLTEANVKRIQVGSFVHPKIVPQMADTDEFIRRIKQSNPDVLLTALILNERGLERAISCGLKHLSLSVSVSESHSLRNVRRTAQEALSSVIELIKVAVSSGITVRAGAQCAFGCVYEGTVPEEAVLKAASQLVAAGASELNLADTTGMANPAQIRRLVSMIKGEIPNVEISLHLHDTRGLGLANMTAGYDAGVHIFDVSTGGLGGCPFVTGASGNVPAEDAVNLFHQMGVDTGIDLEAICKVVEKYESILGRPLPGRMTRVIRSKDGGC